ncbi:FxsA family protein [Pseudolabrys sp. FHR47]|uniref:FxsA family protein n=1 Tax=Pseudolabrys sp. FHR47 TaxID=2562284 RepID=UPI0010BF1D24|nr:FxsA family protein [Pseudolabrys sp. FHR47]
MNVAKWLVLGLLALPLAELAVFIAVAAAWGFVTALALLIGLSLAGGVILRRAGGNHVQRVRVAMRDGFGRQEFSALSADGTGGLTLLGGLLLAVPGLITGVIGLLVLLVPLWRSLSGAAVGRSPTAPHGVVDLEPEQWRRVDDPRLPDRERDGAER